MTRLCSNAVSILSAWLIAMGSSAHASEECNPDFGDKAQSWVNNDATTQSRELAKADYAARSFNFRLVGYERLHARIAQLVESLSRISQEIAALDASNRTDAALAVEREQLSERLLTGLYIYAGVVESLRQQNSEMLTPLDRAGFTRRGLGAVGRETLVASMREIGASSASTLAGRYGIYVQVTLDENGNPQKGQGGANAGMGTTVGSALIQTGNPYAIAAGVVLIIGGFVLEEKCKKNWDEQRDRVANAASLLPSKLITDDEQWALVEAAERSEVVSFTEHGKKAGAAIDALHSRWKTLFAANAARAGAADAVLTVAKVEKIRKDLAHGIDPAEIRLQVAITEVAADIGRVNDAIARSRVPVITGCLSAAGVAAEEDQIDGVLFARAQFKALRAQGGFAPLYPLLDQSDAFAMAAQREVGTSGPTSTRRLCPKGGAFSELSLTAFARSRDGVPVVNLDFFAERANPLKTALTRKKAGSHRRTAASGRTVLPILAKAFPGQGIAWSDAAVGSSFCVAIRDGGTYRCGDGETGIPYGSGFGDTGNPESDLLAGGNDGSFAKDNRRMSAKIDQASQNIQSRIEEIRTRVSEARLALPTWTANNTAALVQMTDRAIWAEGDDAAHEVIFRTTSAPLLTKVNIELDAFRAGAADPAAVAALVRSAGGADMSLPGTPRTSLPVTVPAITGITALDVGFGPGSSSAARAVMRERWKAEETLAADAAALALSRELLNQAEFAALSSDGASSRIVDELVRDSASIRFAAAGRLGATIAIVRPDGSIGRVPLIDSQQIPENALVNVAHKYRNDREYFQAGAAKLDSELAGGTRFAGRRSEILDTARDLYGRANTSFSSGKIAEARTWISMAIGALDIATRFIPGIDWGRDVYEAVSGRDLFTGAELDTFDRVTAVIGVVSAGISNDVFGIRSVMKGLDDVSAAKLEKIYEFGQTVDRTTEAELRYSAHAVERMEERFVTRAEIREVLDNHTPYWSVEHQSYTAIGSASTRTERIAVAIDVEQSTIKTVIVEKPTDIPFERTRFEEGINLGKPRYERIDLD